MLKTPTFETLGNEKTARWRRATVLCLLAAVMTTGCARTRSRDKGQVRVWPPQGAKQSGTASIEISDETPSSANPRLQTDALANNETAAPVVSPDQLQRTGRDEVLGHNKQVLGHNKQRPADIDAEIARQISVLQESYGMAGGKTPPVAEMKDASEGFAARQPQPSDAPQVVPSSRNSLADANVSLTTGKPNLRRIPSPPAEGRNLGVVQAADYAETTSNAQPGRVHEISPARYDSASQSTSPTKEKAASNEGSADSGAAAEPEEIKPRPPLGAVPQQPNRFSIKPETSRYADVENGNGRPAATSNTGEASGTHAASSNTGEAGGTQTASANTGEASGTHAASANTGEASGTQTASANTGEASGTQTASANTGEASGTQTASANTGEASGTQTASANTGEASGTHTASANTGEASGTHTATDKSEAEEDWRTALYHSIDQLDRQIARESDPLERQRMEASHRVLHALLSDREKALQPIKGTAPAAQKYWAEQNLALITMLDPLGSPQDSRRARLASRYLKNAQRQLAASSGLDVRNVLFCQQVMGFGWYKEFKPVTFKADQEVILYAELENFAYSELADGFETEFQSGYQVYDDSGRRVAEHDFLVVKQVCRNVQTDYFLPYRMHIPKHLVPGKYRLQLTVEDRKGNKFGQSFPIDFEVVK